METRDHLVATVNQDETVCLAVEDKMLKYRTQFPERTATMDLRKSLIDSKFIRVLVLIPYSFHLINTSGLRGDVGEPGPKGESGSVSLQTIFFFCFFLQNFSYSIVFNRWAKIFCTESLATWANQAKKVKYDLLFINE